MSIGDYPSAEAAFFAALRDVPDGESFDFVIHQDHCCSGIEDMGGLCICTPQMVHHNHEAQACADDDGWRQEMAPAGRESSDA